ncbi:hypothetical protein CGRA01v4_08892 [Colletotrichum graminicola]|nr:hypothetical protein CGRA01v4_08892 [Colletotrichum graminicola]
MTAIQLWLWRDSQPDWFGLLAWTCVLSACLSSLPSVPHAVVCVDSYVVLRYPLLSIVVGCTETAICAPRSLVFCKSRNIGPTKANQTIVRVLRPSHGFFAIRRLFLILPVLWRPARRGSMTVVQCLPSLEVHRNQRG